MRAAVSLLQHKHLRSLNLLILLLLSSFSCSLFGLTTVTVTNPPYNAKGNGISDDGPALQAAFTSGNSVSVPPGTYLVNNSRGALTVNNFSGTLQMSSAAEIVCNTPTQPCLIFNGGTSPSFIGLHVSYTTVPTDDCRSGAVAPCVTLYFNGQTSPMIENTVVENAWAIAMSVNNTYNAKVVNTLIHNSTRDGLFLQDNQTISVQNLTVSGTGDDCFGFHSTSAGNGRSGGSASGISCTDIRGGGLAFAGGTNISVSDFVVNGTSAQGIYVMSDSSQGYLVPGNITLTHGVLRSIGTVADTIPRTGTQNGIQWWTNGGPNLGPLTFNDIIIDKTNGYGITGFNAQSAALTDVYVSNSGLDGATSNASCAQFVYNGTVSISKFTARSCYRDGLMAISNTNVSITDASVFNAWQKGRLESGAKTFDLVSNNTIQVTTTLIGDYSNPPNGYTFNENANGSGFVNGIVAQIPFGSLSIIHGSSGVTIQK
jgi:hypothetical protein